MCATCDDKQNEGTRHNWYGVDLVAWVNAAMRGDSSAAYARIMVPIPSQHGKVMALSLEPLYDVLSGA